jgi:hypothetical protein
MKFSLILQDFHECQIIFELIILKSYKIRNLNNDTNEINEINEKKEMTLNL